MNVPGEISPLTRRMWIFWSFFFSERHWWSTSLLCSSLPSASWQGATESLKKTWCFTEASFLFKGNEGNISEPISLTNIGHWKERRDYTCDLSFQVLVTLPYMVSHTAPAYGTSSSCCVGWTGEFFYEMGSLGSLYSKSYNHTEIL